MKTLEQYLTTYHQAVQAAVPDEQVLAFGILSLVGSTKSAFIGVVSTLAGVLQRRKGRKLAPGFPTNVIVAVTPTRLLAFGYRPSGRSLKMKRIVMACLRRDVRVELIATASERGLHHVRFWLPDGSAPELELLRGLGRYEDVNQPFVRALQTPV